MAESLSLVSVMLFSTKLWVPSFQARIKRWPANRTPFSSNNCCHLFFVPIVERFPDAGMAMNTGLRCLTYIFWTLPDICRSKFAVWSVYRIPSEGLNASFLKSAHIVSATASVVKDGDVFVD